MRCTREDCEPVEQIRGEVKAGEYYDVIESNKKERWGSVPDPEKYGIPIYPNERGHFVVPEDINPLHCVEISDANKNDFRIVCKACGRASPWGAKDFPGMPDAGADYTRKKWNE